MVGALRASPAAAGTVGERLPRGAGALQAMAGAGRWSARDRRAVEKASQEKARQVERARQVESRPERGGPERDYGPSR